MAYALPQDCRDFSSLASVIAKTDPQLVILIARAERWINAFTKQNFNADVKPLRVSGSGSRMLILPERLAVLTKVEFLDLDDGGAIVLSSEEIKDVFNRFWYLVSDFTFRTPRQRLSFDRFPTAEDNIEITGTWGYSAVPAEVKDALCAIVEKIVAEEGSVETRTSTFKSEKIGDYSYTKEAPAITTGQQVARMIPAEAQLLLRDFFKPIRPRAI